MAIVFGSLFTIDYHGPVEETSFAAPVQETSAFGVPGVTVLAGARTTRNVSTEVWIYGGYATEAALLAAIESVNAMTNREATLITASQSYGRSLFVGLVPRQRRSRFYSRQFASWIYIGEARFVQLQP
jgi:hypothetical protein